MQQWMARAPRVDDTPKPPSMRRAPAIILAVLLTGCSGTLTMPGTVDGGIPEAAVDAGVTGDAGPCPPLSVLVSYGDGGMVCIDKYEEAVVEVGPDGGTTPHNYYDVTDGLTVKAFPAQGMPPQAYMSETQSQTACALAGKRLCTLTEWMAGCQGPNGYTYPYGNTYIPGACNDGRTTNPVNDCFGACATFNNTQLNSPCCDMLPNTVSSGGAFPMCVSDWGLYDMHGNLEEWTSTISTQTGLPIFQGSFFVHVTSNGNGCYYSTPFHAANYHDYSIGFRCCSDPK
jgi:hypothetical protein